MSRDNDNDDTAKEKRVKFTTAEAGRTTLVMSAVEATVIAHDRELRSRRRMDAELAAERYRTSVAEWKWRRRKTAGGRP